MTTPWHSSFLKVGRLISVTVVISCFLRGEFSQPSAPIYSLSPSSTIPLPTSSDGKTKELTKIFDQWSQRYLSQWRYLSLSQRDIVMIDGIGGPKEFDYLKRLLNLIYGPQTLGLSSQEWVESREETVRMVAFLEQEKLISLQEHDFLTQADAFFNALLPIFFSKFASLTTEEGKDFSVLPQRTMDDFIKECLRKGQLPGAANLDDFERRIYFYSLYYENTSRVLTIFSRVFTDLAAKIIPPKLRPIEGEAIDDKDFRIVERSGIRFSYLFGFTNSPVYQMTTQEGISAEALFISQPEKIMALFYHSAKREIRPSSEILEAARKIIEQSPKKLNTPQGRQTFLDILRLDSDVSYTLWRMNEIGLLSIVFPEFKNIKGIFTEPSHRLAVHVHTLYVLDTLEHLPAPEQGDPLLQLLKDDPVLQEVRDLFIEIRKNPELILVLRLSVLFHDIAKGKYSSYTAGHATKAAQRIVPDALSSFVVSPDIVRLIQWLVKNHMQLNAISQPRYAQETFITEVLRFAKDSELSLKGLNLLYLISYGDKLGVDPSRRIEILHAEHPSAIDRLANTFHVLRRLKENGRRPRDDILRERQSEQKQEETAFHDKKERILKEELRRLDTHLKTYFDSIPIETLKTEEIQREVREGFIVNFHNLYRQYASQFPISYLRSRTTEEIMGQIIFFKHLHALRETQLSTVLVRFSPYESGHERYLEILIGMNMDKPGLLATMSGVLAANGINIVGAEINTPNGIVFNRFFGYLTTPTRDIEAFQKGLQRDLTMAIELNFPVSSIFARHGETYRFIKIGGNTIIASTKTKVSFRKETIKGERISVMTIRTPDRVGLLHLICRVLSERFGMNIFKVSVNTYLDDAQDEFVLKRTEFDQDPTLSADEENELSRHLKKLLDREIIFMEDIAPPRVISVEKSL